MAKLAFFLSAALLCTLEIPAAASPQRFAACVARAGLTPEEMEHPKSGYAQRNVEWCRKFAVTSEPSAEMVRLVPKLIRQTVSEDLDVDASRINAKSFARCIWNTGLGESAMQTAIRQKGMLPGMKPCYDKFVGH